MKRPVKRIALWLCLAGLLSAAGCGDDDGDSNNNSGLCGNDVLDPGEACDGDDVAGETCTGLGYHGGVLRCAADCALDLTLCEVGGYCGDGYLQEPFEVCDASDAAIQRCESLDPQYDAGDVMCGTDCQLDFGQCSTCGDGVIEGTELCDDDNEILWDGCNSCQVVEFAIAQDATSVGMMAYTAMSSNGSMVVPFNVDWYDGQNSYWQGFIQRFAASGESAGPTVAVTPLNQGSSSYLAAAMDDQGRAVVTWTDRRTDTLLFQRYDAAGQTLGATQIVAHLTEGDAWLPHVSMSGSGAFAVSWSAEDATSNRDDVFARLYDADGAPMTDAFQLNDDLSRTHHTPQVGMHGSGRFTATWLSGDGTDYAMVARVFTDQGVGDGGVTTIAQSGPDAFFFELSRMSVLPDGRALLTWLTVSESSDPTSIVWAQRLTAAAALDGPAIEVATITNGYGYPSAALLADGRFTVVWSRLIIMSGGGGIPSGVHIRDFDAASVPLGDERKLNVKSNILGYVTSTATDGSRFAVVYTHYDQRTESASLFGQRFADQGEPIGVLPW